MKHLEESCAGVHAASSGSHAQGDPFCHSSNMSRSSSSIGKAERKQEEEAKEKAKMSDMQH